MTRRDVEGRTSIAFCGGLTGRRWVPADPIRRRPGRDRNDEMGGDGCPRALFLRGVDGCDWFASESTPQIRVLITQHLRGFRHYTEGVFDDRAGTFSRQRWRRPSTQAVSVAFAEV